MILGLLAAGAIVGAALWTPAELRRTYYRRHRPWRDAPAAFVEEALVSALTGIGAGMVLCALFMAAVALLARV